MKCQQAVTKNEYCGNIQHLAFLRDFSNSSVRFLRKICQKRN